MSEAVTEGLCAVRVAFDIEVAVAADRLPSGATGPFVAHVDVVAEQEGAIIASVVEDGSASPYGGATAGGGAPILRTGG